VRTGVGRKERSFSGGNLRPQLSQEPGHAAFAVLDRPRGGPVDPSGLGTLVLPDPIPCQGKERRVHHEIEQIIKATAPVGRRPTVQFGLNPQYPLPHQKRTVEQSADIHRGLFRHDSILPAHIAAALPHARGFPTLEVLRRLRPIPVRSASSGPNPTVLRWKHGPARQDWDGSRVHLLPIDELGTQLYPGGLREYAAGFPPELSRPMASATTGDPTATMRPRAAIPALIHQVRAGSC
jgi:hypothetical protein